jgi:hypothetical protein
MLIKSIFQVFEDAPFEWVLPAVEGLIADKTDRHKQRAAGELIGGTSYPSSPRMKVPLTSPSLQASFGAASTGR